MIQFLLVALAISLAVNVGMFLVAFRYKTDMLTDVSYAATFILLAAYGVAVSSGTAYHLLLLAMVVIWAVRLGGFLLYRISRTGKDSRFDNIRGNFTAFGRFWLGQGLSVWVILLPALVAFTASTPSIAPFAWIGVVIWAAGLVLESAADWQKYSFNSQLANRGKWIQSGVWKYSRHPNYMGEMLVWIGLYMYAVSVLSLPLGIVVAVGPLFIICLLLFISGIPLLEKFADARWGANVEYKKYKSRTSMLVPWPPKKT